MDSEAKNKDFETGRKICDVHASIRDDQTFSDVVVVAGDREFPCHRAILAAASEYFKVALTTDMKEARERRITLHDVSEEMFSTLLDCIYDGKYVLTEENLFDVWKAADMLEITVLTDQCMGLLKEICSTTMSENNCVDYFCKVRLFGQQAQTTVLDFIYKNFTTFEIRAKAGLFTMDELKSLIAHRKLKVWCEDQAIEFVLKWAEENKDSIITAYSTEDSSEYDSSISECGSTLADVLECTRYLLISGGCLHGTLATHPLVFDDWECLGIVDKIRWYQAQPHLHQTWCPPAAIHREHSELTNVLLLCQLDSNGQLTALNLEKMVWENVTLAGVGGLTDGTVRFGSYHSRPCDQMKFLYYDSWLYYISGNQIYSYSLETEESRGMMYNTRENSVLSVVNESIFVYSCDNEDKTCVSKQRLFHFPSKFNKRDHQHNSLSTIGRGYMDGMHIKAVTSIGSTEIVFCGRDDVEYYTIFSTSEWGNSFSPYQDQIPSSSRLVTLRHDKEVFVLQENGHLWRIQRDESVDQIKISFELVLWDGEFSLNGAVLYNDQLMVVGDFPDQKEFSDTLDRSLPGVFKSLRKVKICQSGVRSCPGIALAVLPKSLFQKPIAETVYAKAGASMREGAYSSISSFRTGTLFHPTSRNGPVFGGFRTPSIVRKN